MLGNYFVLDERYNIASSYCESLTKKLLILYIEEIPYCLLNALCVSIAITRPCFLLLLSFKERLVLVENISRK